MGSITVYFREPLRSPISRTGNGIYMYEMGTYTIFKCKDSSNAIEEDILLSVVTHEVLYIDWGK